MSEGGEGQPVFRRLCLLGIGLIGSSVARAARARGLVGEIVGHARSERTRATALALGLVDRAEADPAAAVIDADCVMLCAPLGAYVPLTTAIAPALAPGAVLTDVGSVKGCVVRDLAPLVPGGVHFVPAHPVAGTEHSGPEAGFAELFEGRWCILTPPAGTDRAAIDRLAALWRGMGSLIEEMSVDHHDRVLAITSHLPHLIAYTIVGTADDLGEDIKQEVIKFSASGFRDFTRIAASDPVMWRDIFLSNKEAALEIMQRFSEDLTALQKAIRRGDGDTLAQLFARTRDIRRRVIEARQA
ncbi:MAG: prephenate/arogenate dehydrogenase family protein [Alphaproteobacteria bacterium]|jgi:cyclohexadieny/prephenate dehydrogenase|nr:prephenate/arogenate dehydrogenase family protein [Alphaproteobacteria bacterium]